MKFLKILLCSLLIVTIVTVPCLATNEGLYGHYISPGVYVFDEVVSFTVNQFSLFFDYSVVMSSGIVREFDGMSVNSNVIYFFGDTVSNNYGISYNVSSGWRTDSERYITVLEGFYIYDASYFSWWVSNLTRVDSGYDDSLLDSFLSLFTFVGQWISGAAEDLTLMFWDPIEGSLTFVGVLAVASLALAVSFLIIGLIQRFLKFRS